MSKIKLLCFPHAGGSSLYYSKLRLQLCDDNIEPHIIQYPGRDIYINEPMAETIKDLAYFVIEKNRSLFEEDFAVWGHSMGSVVGYEAIKCCMRELNKEPLLYIASGASAPCDMSIDTDVNTISKDELLAYLNVYGGAGMNHISQQQYNKFFLPIIKGDANLLYHYSDLFRTEIPCPILLMNGNNDKIDLSNWEKYTKNRPIMSKEFSGGHFFINEVREEVAFS